MRKMPNPIKQILAWILRHRTALIKLLVAMILLVVC